MARDWRFAPASFDGAAFYVDTSELEESRRIVTHEYPGSESHDNEDLGRNATRYEFTAYFVSDTADADSAALRARLLQQGPGLLILPMFGALQARAIRWKPAWNQQKLNYVGMPVSFVEEGANNASAPAGLGVAQLAEMAAGLAAVLSGPIDTALIGQPLSSYSRADVTSALIGMAASVAAVGQGTPLPAATATAAQLALTDAASSLAQGPQTDPQGAANAILTQLDAIVIEGQSANPSALASTLSAAASAALTDYAALLAAVGVDPLVSIVPLVSATAFAAQAARVLASASYADRPSAIAARAQVASLAGAVTSVYAGLGPAGSDAFDAIYGKAAQQISSLIANLAPVVIVELNVSLPSNVLAYRLYGDPNRGIELVTRNGIATPCFMPTLFEAAAS